MKTILVADEDTSVRNLVRLTFTEHMGYNVVAASNGADAILKATEIEPDVVLVDVSLSNHNGYSVSREIKNDPLLNDAYVILLGPGFEPFDEKKVFAARADDIITKPFEPEELTKKVLGHFEKKGIGKTSSSKNGKIKNKSITLRVIIYERFKGSLRLSKEWKVPVKADVQRLNSPERREEVKIGKSILIKGEVSGGQDLIIDGGLEGKIQLKENQVTVGENGKISGEIYARSIIIHGQVVGNMFAEERLEIKASGSLKGDITSPRVVIDEGAYFKGSVHMEEEMHKRLERPATETEILKVVESEE